MKNRNPLLVILLPLVTFGIYMLYWFVKTKGEMNKLGASIPTAWLIIVPFVNIWWMWKYSEGADKVTNGQMSAVLAFVLLFLIGPIGAGIIQLEFNKLGVEAPVVADSAAAAAPEVSADAPEVPAGVETPASDDSQTPTTQPPAPKNLVQ